MRSKVYSFILFLLINVAVIGVNSNPPFHAMESILIPNNDITGTVNFYHFLLNICVCLIFISAVIRMTDEQFQLNSYILTRTTEKKAFMLHIIRVGKELTILVFLKLTADICLGQIKGFENFDKFLPLALTTLITVYLWIVIVYLLKLLRISTKFTYFIMAGSIVLAQYLSTFVPVLTVLVIASSSYLKHVLYWLALKVLLLVCIIYINLVFCKKYESYEEREEKL